MAEGAELPEGGLVRQEQKGAQARLGGIGVEMPILRASYEAEAIIPRFSPPTATGLPRKWVSAACSTV